VPSEALHVVEFTFVGGFESLPLRQIFYAFISNHLQRKSGLEGSAYGFQGISSELRYWGKYGLVGEVVPSGRQGQGSALHSD
jgi:hypothetical protein